MDEEITVWLKGLTEGDDLAIQQIWERYYEKLILLAYRRLGAHKRRVADEEDVALSAFQSFCTAGQAGRFPRLSDRHDLWAILVTITTHKAIDQIRGEMRQKRGGGAVRGESVFIQRDWANSGAGINGVLGKEPSPELAASLSEEFERLLDGLQDNTLRRIALLKLQGYSNSEIAEELGCVRRTVGRKLELIQKKWGHGRK